MSKPISDFLKSYNIETKNLELYTLAFTHASHNSEQNTKHKDYERLEFIGDSVLGFVVASRLFELHPEMREGDLTKAKSFFVQSEYLAKLSRQENYPEYIIFGKSLSYEAIVNNDSILEDVFEAVIGALYLDKGIKVAADFIKKIYGDELKEFTLVEVKDYKSMLQVAMQAEHRESVEYTIYKEEGPPHDRTFYAIVKFNGIVLGKGQGKSKKNAEQEAAKDALSKKATI